MDVWGRWVGLSYAKRSFFKDLLGHRVELSLSAVLEDSSQGAKAMGILKGVNDDFVCLESFDSYGDLVRIFINLRCQNVLCLIDRGEDSLR